MKDSPPRILLVLNNAALRRRVQHALSQAGFHVMGKTCQQALRVVVNLTFDIVVLCVPTSEAVADQLCRRIRETPRIQSLPILMITGEDFCGNNANPVPVLDLKGLASQVREVLRRHQMAAPQAEVIKRGGLIVEAAARQVSWHGRAIPALTPKEFEVLKLLASHSPSVLKKSTLISKVWGVSPKQIHERSLDVHIRRIRLKLGPSGAAHLKTIPAVGYQWLDTSTLRTSRI